MLIHFTEAFEQFTKAGRSDRQHGRESDGGIHRVSSTDPIPEPEHVGRIDPERRDFVSIRRNGNKVLGDRFISNRIYPTCPAAICSVAVCSVAV